MMKPKAYDLLVKVFYNATKDVTMGKSTPEIKTHGPNKTQEKLQRKGYPIKSSTVGLEYTPKPPLCVMIKRMANYHIAEAGQELWIYPKTTTRRTVFQRLGTTTRDSIQHVSIFQRLGEDRSRGYDEPLYHQKKRCKQAL
ncbi:hypothetical protein LIER_32167 [Lithospermum erythrorhizon]|uniref:Uncharacterized protein n=1 Tax=Lithospermum erythrorhizon TaxID=34254 RepID=A0AAV3RWQ4_LITER